MDMSKAALPPPAPYVSEKDMLHPLYHTWSTYRSSMARLMVQASDFQDWLYQYESNLRNEAATKLPEYESFRAWMVANQGGARQCPAGCFPHNFYFWIEGGRW